MKPQITLILITALVGAAGAAATEEIAPPDLPDINGDKPGNCLVEVSDDPEVGGEAIVNITSNAPDTTILIRNKWYRVFRGLAPVEDIVLVPDVYEITAKSGGNLKTTEFDITVENGKRYDLNIELDKHSMSRGVHLAIILGGAGAIMLAILFTISISLKGAN